MAMELLMNPQTVEPFEATIVYRPIRKTMNPAAPAAEAVAQPSLTQRLEKTPSGRVILGCMRWGVVLSLILSGYFGAELASNGIDVVKAHAFGAPQPVVATVEAAR
jgi:hypothetical protein